MSYIMMNGTSNPREVIFNGVRPKWLFYNGEVIWGDDVLDCYRVYIMWNPVAKENICIDGIWVDSQTVTTDDVYDGAYQDSEWTSLTDTEMTNLVTNNGEPCAKYCQGYFFKIKPNFDLNTLEFKTSQYYQPTGDVTVTIQEQYVNGHGTESYKTIAVKTVTLAADTTYTINRGEGV